MSKDKSNDNDIIERFKKLRESRGHIIESALNIELQLDILILQILFKDNPKQRGFFDACILNKKFLLGRKIEMLEDYIKYTEPPKVSDTQEFLVGLKTINKVRNYFAHARLSNSMHFYYGQPTVAAKLGMYKKGSYKQIEVEEEYNKFQNAFLFCSQFLLKFDTEENYGIYFG